MPGHPLTALLWLANCLARYGLGLRAGQIVMTDSIVATRWVHRGDLVVVRSDGPGTALVEFA